MDIASQEFPAAASNGLHVQTRDLRNRSVSTTTQLQRLEAGVKPPLLLVERGKEYTQTVCHLGRRLLTVNLRSFLLLGPLAPQKLALAPGG